MRIQTSLMCGFGPFAALTCCSTAHGQVAPEEQGAAGILTRERITGDWAGKRTSLEESGLSIELDYTFDFLSNVSGGVDRDSEILGNVDLVLTADMDKIFGWKGATASIYGLGTHGGSISDKVGDLQGVDNIEAPATVKLYEAWIEQTFFDENVSLLGGLYDVNSEFDVIPSAALFMHSAHGTGSEFGNSGKNGPSIFPVTSLAARAQVRPTDTTYIRAVVADGVPGDLGDPIGTQITLDGDDGLLLAAEFGYYCLPSEELRGRTRLHKEKVPPAEQRYGHFGKYALGIWGYTSEFNDFFRLDGSGNPQQNTGTSGVYALGEHGLSYEKDDPFQGLSAFVRVGLADDKANIFDGYAGGGLVYRGALPGRDQDRLGLAIAAAHLGDDFQRSIELGGNGVDDWEVAIELTYRAWIAPSISIQPDIQYVINPGGAPQLDDALIMGARLVLSF